MSQENEITTTRKSFYRNEPNGVIIYETDATVVERDTDNRITIKVVLDKCTQWDMLRDELQCEVAALSNWLWQQIRKGVDHLSELESWEYSEEEIRECQEMWMKPNDTYNYMYFYDDGNWVMYDNDDNYLFLFEMTRQEAENAGLGHELDGLEDRPKDSLFYITSFLGRWWQRVNGYPECREK